MNNTFWKSIRVASHPAALVAVLLLLVNDHILRLITPSWWTGKLGGFAWLFFIPYPVITLLSLAAPEQKARQMSRWVFPLVGLIYALAKTWTPFHASLTNLFSAALGAPISLVLDPTDLLTLPALWLSHQLWSATPETAPRRQRVWQPGWLVLPLSALLTIANVSAPEYGIACLHQESDAIIAQSTWQAFQSRDGGLTWEEIDPEMEEYCYDASPPAPFTIQDPSEENVLYHIEPGQSIQRSSDGGNTWTTEHMIKSATQAEEAYYYKTRPGYAQFIPVPITALIDPRTGNLVMAMGQEGVLVRASIGEYKSIPLEPFEKAPLDSPSALWTILLGEVFLGAVFSLLFFTGLGIRLHGVPRGKKLLRVIPFGLATLGWLIITGIFPPAQTSLYMEVIPGLGTILLALITVPLGIEALIQFIRLRPSKIIFSLGGTLASFVLFLLPYVLWAMNTLRGYYLAFLFALLLNTALFIVTYFVVFPRQKTHTPESSSSQP
jgi:hypothetical protein